MGRGQSALRRVESREMKGSQVLRGPKRDRGRNETTCCPLTSPAGQARTLFKCPEADIGVSPSRATKSEEDQLAKGWHVGGCSP